MDSLARDLLLGLRLLRRDKAFTLTAGLTLALCIGANTALFSVVHHVLLRPLPVPDPERLVLMSNLYPKAGAVDSSNSGVPDHYDRLQAVTALEEQSLHNESSVSIGRDGLPTRIQVMNATPSLFRVLRVEAARGRTLHDEDGVVGQDRKVVLGDAFWRRQFGGDPAAVGRDLHLDGQPYTVVGVMPPALDQVFPGITLWRPLAFTPEQKADGQRHSNNYWNLGRLRPGATLQQAQAQVDALNAANLERFPQYKELLQNAGFHTVARGFRDHLVRRVKPTLHLMWGGALFVLLIGCVNVANLALVRARARAKETATRLALGAGRAQLARQLVAESVLLVLGAAAAGVALGAAALRTFSTVDLEGLPFGSAVEVDLATLLYSVAVAIVIGVAMGLLPALGGPGNLAAVLREEGRATSSGHRARALRRTLVVAQVAFTFVLLAGAGLLLASFRKVLGVDPGFDGTGVLTGSVVLPRSRYADDAQLRAFTDEILHRVRATPGVAAAGATDTIPFGGFFSDSVILAEGHQMQPGESVISPSRVDVTPGYFEAMKVKLRRGRFFDQRDVAGAPPAVIVDEALARRFWPGQDPVGRRLYQPDDINNLLAVTDKTVFITVVGVIEDVKLRDLAQGGDSVGAYYFPMAQYTSRLLTFAVRTTGSPDALAGPLRQAVASLDRELPLFDVRTMEQRAQDSLLNRRSPALLSLAFAAVALVLSAVGIYGVLAYLVAQRRKEIGIRMALGSDASGIFRLVLREGAALVGGGLLLGLAGAFAVRRSLESQLFGVTATDPVVLLAVVGTLTLVAVAACGVPARRAMRIDPVVALSE
jgi:predicted permease